MRHFLMKISNTLCSIYLERVSSIRCEVLEGRGTAPPLYFSTSPTPWLMLMAQETSIQRTFTWVADVCSGVAESMIVIIRPKPGRWSHWACSWEHWKTLDQARMRALSKGDVIWLWRKQTPLRRTCLAYTDTDTSQYALQNMAAAGTCSPFVNSAHMECLPFWHLMLFEGNKYLCTNAILSYSVLWHKFYPLV